MVSRGWIPCAFAAGCIGVSQKHSMPGVVGGKRGRISPSVAPAIRAADDGLDRRLRGRQLAGQPRRRARSGYWWPEKDEKRDRRSDRRPFAPTEGGRRAASELGNARRGARTEKRRGGVGRGVRLSIFVGHGSYDASKYAGIRVQGAASPKGRPVRCASTSATSTPTRTATSAAPAGTISAKSLSLTTEMERSIGSSSPTRGRRTIGAIPARPAITPSQL